MRCLEINKRKIWYALYMGMSDEVDANGNLTGDHVKTYAEPVSLKINYSYARRHASIEPFGIETDYTHTMVTDKMSCPITESTLVWIDKDTTENANFRVVKVAKSLNSITYDLEEIANP